MKYLIVVDMQKDFITCCDHESGISRGQDSGAIDFIKWMQRKYSDGNRSLRQQ